MHARLEIAFACSDKARASNDYQHDRSPPRHPDGLDCYQQQIRQRKILQINCEFLHQPWPVSNACSASRILAPTVLSNRLCPHEQQPPHHSLLFTCSQGQGLTDVQHLLALFRGRELELLKYIENRLELPPACPHRLPACTVP